MGMRAAEDRPTPATVYNFRIYLQAFLIAFGALTFGYDSAFLGTTIARASFKKDFGISTMSAAEQAATSSNITSCFQAAAFFGGLGSWLFNERFGRKPTLQASAIIFVIGAIMMTATSSSLALIYTGRSLTGIGCGGITAVVPSYIAEISPVAIRGILVGLFEIMYQIGSVIGFWINYGVSNSKSIKATSVLSWRLPMAVQLIPGGIFLIGCFIIKESPAWLYRKGRSEQALRNLSYLRSLPAEHQYIQEEVALIEARMAEELAVAGEGSGIWSYVKGCFRELSVKGMRNRLVIVFASFALQNFSGANAINYYSPTLFKSIGITNVNLYTGIYGLIKAISSIVFYIWFIDRVGRKKPWIFSCAACACTLLYVGIYVKLGHPAGQLHPSASTQAGGKAATAMIMLFSAFWAFGMNGLPWVYASEIFPLRVRSFTGAYAAACQWLWQFVITKSTPYIFSAMGFGVWIFFAGCLCLSILFAIFFLPETKGLTIEQIDEKFGFYPPHPVDAQIHDDRHDSLDKKEQDVYRETV